MNANKLLKALRAILTYTQKKTPRNLVEAQHKLALIEIIARETLADHDQAGATPQP